MHRCILRNDQTVGPEVIVEKRDSYKPVFSNWTAYIQHIDKS